jgi:hypothetical protein
MGEDMNKKPLTLRGQLSIYHYTQNDLGEETILDPKETVKQRSSYSQNDYKLSGFPRVFYYTDLSKVEWQVKSKNLYTTKVDGGKILNLQSALEEYKSNKDEMKLNNPKAWEVIDGLIGRGYLDWDSMFRSASKNYLGIIYDRGNLPMVNIFKSLKVKKYAGI